MYGLDTGGGAIGGGSTIGGDTGFGVGLISTVGASPFVLPFNGKSIKPLGLGRNGKFGGATGAIGPNVTGVLVGDIVAGTGGKVAVTFVGDMEGNIDGNIV